MQQGARVWRALPLSGAVGATALLAGGAALVLAAQHPLSPPLALIGVLGVAALMWWQPHVWLFGLPALLPVLSLAPWTGWSLVDESDLFVLALLAAGYARWAFALRARAPAWPQTPAYRPLGLLSLALLLTLLIGTLRGWLDAGATPDWTGALHAGHDSAWNTLRVGKSLLWALLLLPLLRQALQAGHRHWLGAGMLAGLSLVGAIVLWERHTYAGLLDFSDSYRTSAWFWEMHVGGGAIDAYLALAVPFAVWGLWAAPTRAGALGALMVLALGVYAVLTTYSRGVLVAVLLSLGLMVALALVRRLQPAAPGVWRGNAVLAVALLLAGEAALVLGGGAMLPRRLAQTGEDFMGRLAHWQAGLSLLETPADWLLGIGLGRLPAHHSRRVPGGEFPGQAVWQADAQGRAQLVLSGPPTRAARAPDFGLTQRVHLAPGGGYSVRWRASPLAGADPPRLLFRLCERHLLYSARCQSALGLAGDAEQRVRLEGPAFGRSGGVLSVTVLGAGQRVQLHSLQLLDAQGRQLLQNSAFTETLRRWWPRAQGHFQPWHIDNLYLELLIERGLLGVLVFAVWLAWAARGLVQGFRERAAPEQRMAWGVSAALLGVLALGAVVSLMENPRVALLLMLCMWATEPKAQINCSLSCRNEM